MATDGDPAPSRVRLTVRGVVQGVGFRPFVYRLATEEGLVGSVANTSAGVIIEVQGDPLAIGRFGRRLRTETPPLATIHEVKNALLPPVATTGFVIDASRAEAGATTAVPPDVALCADCRREIRDPADRRFGYPFTNCTNCGPRWTIIEGLPYDRPLTSLASFSMCDACRAEYEDPANRRFHAQPNACLDCGPRAWLCGPGGVDRVDERPLAAAADALARGGIVAVRGLGGFHLAVRADDEAAVARLRERKHRAAKPLAVMARDLEAARALAVVTRDEAALLASPAAPIVLVARLASAPVAAAVAPGHRRLGVMLPPTPLHLLLLDETAARGIPALVMTSGNIADEPICIGNDEALASLDGIADRWLLHDRGIMRRADDSVVQVIDGAPLLVRRSRGWAPEPIPVDVPASGPVLAAGGDLKNTVCLLKDGWAYLSPHVGDLEDLRTRAFFTETTAGLAALLGADPVAYAHDRHPGYAAANWARDEARHRGLPAIAVQHHHAHLVAVAAERGLRGKCVGLILDGTGYGDDGTIWGGEILVGDVAGFTRAGWFEPVPLPGGDAAIRAPWRYAVACLRAAGLADGGAAALAATWPDVLAGRPVADLLAMLESVLNCPPTSSCGRLFDAVAALAGVRAEVAYEAQAALELTALTDADAVAAAMPLPGVLEAWRERVAQAEAMDLRRRKSEAAAAAGPEPLLLPTAAIIRGVVARLQAGDDAARISAAFHRTLIDLLADAAMRVSLREGGLPIVLGGGVFLNEWLAGGLPEALARRGLRAYLPRQLPPGDGGLALGQAVVAAHRLARGPVD
jgi:hydrogenase maturation protein HypF